MAELSRQFQNFIDAIGVLNAVIAIGPPGCGKTSRLEERATALGMNLVRIKGAVSGIGLYSNLWEGNDPNTITVIDDVPGLIHDRQARAILCGAMDTTSRRHLTWAKQNRELERNDIPLSFDYVGKIVVLTNEDWRAIKQQRARTEVAAILSRAFVFEIEIDGRLEMAEHCVEKAPEILGKHRLTKNQQD